MGALSHWVATETTQPAADFNDWIQADGIFLSGGSPYQPVTRFAPEVFAPGATSEPYTPSFFILLAPLTAAPGWLRYLAWLLVQEGALAGLVLAVWAGIGRPSRTEAAVVLALVLPVLPLRQNLFEGQMDLLLVALSAAALLACQRGRQVLAGLAMALAIILKPTVLPVLLLFAYRRSWRMLAVTAAGVAALVAITFPLGYGHQWLPMYRLLGPLGRGSAFIANQSVNGLLLRAWRPDLSGQPIAPLPPAFTIAWYATEAALSGVVLYGLALSRPWRREAEWLLFAVVLLLLGLLQPLAWFHHHVGVVVAIMVTVRLVARRQVPARATLALVAAYVLVTIVAYPIHLAARPIGGVGLLDRPFLRWGTSAAFLGLLVATLVLAFLRVPRPGAGSPWSAGRGGVEGARSGSA